MNVFILKKISGEYEDTHTSCLKAYTDENAAKEIANKENRYYEDLFSKYYEDQININDFIADAFDLYMSETDPQRLEKLKADKNNYDGYYDAADDFYRKEELFLEYVKKCCNDEKTIEKVKRYIEVEDLNFDRPYYTVSRPIELIQ